VILEQFEPVLFEWLDSCTLEAGGWMSTDEVDRDTEQLQVLRQQTVGFLVAQSEHAFAVAMSRNFGDDHNFGTRLHGSFLIPKATVLDGPTPLRAAKRKP
jgi:hypothetical protein